MWNTNNIYALGATQGSITGIGASATITLNSKMFQNSSQLLIAATSIHETIHAYLNYAIATATDHANNHWIDTTNISWLYTMDSYVLINGLPSNYRDHFQMLNNYFDTAVNILAAWDGNHHTTLEYRMTMLYGLDNPGDNSTTIQRDSLNSYYNKIKAKYGITDTAALQQYFKAQLNSPTNKLPSGCN